MGWQESLRTLQKQFEARALNSRGLHHLMVEVADDERDRMMGPDWFRRAANSNTFDPKPYLRADPWSVVKFGGMPWVHPRFREVRADEPIESVPENRLVRDSSGEPRAVFEPMRLRQSFLCGDHTAVGGFESLAEAASQILTDVPELGKHAYSEDLIDLFRAPRGGLRYVFGDVPDQPPVFIAQGWQGGRLVFAHGVLIDIPIAESSPGAEHWLLLLHRLSWRRIPGSPLQGKRFAWHANTTVPYDWVVEKRYVAGLPDPWRERFAQLPTTSYYSVLGERDHPLDVNLASAFAIELLLSAKPRAESPSETASRVVDYTAQPWNNLSVPPIEPADARDLKRRYKPRVVLLTATPTERDMVLRHLEPLPDGTSVFRVFEDNNTFFVGRLGQYPVALCMCAMGGSGRDSAQNVTGEVIRFWKPSAIIMVGIAYGRSPERQKIGDVLVSKAIVAYEPQRVGVDATMLRGPQPQAGPLLLNRFENSAVDWCFRDPTGVACSPHFGPVLSGEKLIDNPDFKSKLFEQYPNAIGGEMEGFGVAAAADREKCEWILVKGICDWADGAKTDRHQAFAAASAVSLVQHVLRQPSVIR